MLHFSHCFVSTLMPLEAFYFLLTRFDANLSHPVNLVSAHKKVLLTKETKNLTKFAVAGEHGKQYSLDTIFLAYANFRIFLESNHDNSFADMVAEKQNIENTDNLVKQAETTQTAGQFWLLLQVYEVMRTNAAPSRTKFF